MQEVSVWSWSVAVLRGRENWFLRNHLFISVLVVESWSCRRVLVRCYGGSALDTACSNACCSFESSALKAQPWFQFGSAYFPGSNCSRCSISAGYWSSLCTPWLFSKFTAVLVTLVLKFSPQSEEIAENEWHWDFEEEDLKFREVPVEHVCGFWHRSQQHMLKCNITLGFTQWQSKN